MATLHEGKFLTDSELKQFLDLCNKYKGERDSILLRLLLFTGARGVEIRGVKKSDLAKRAVLIHGAKKSNDRVIALSQAFYKELVIYSKDMNEDDVLFPVAARTLRYIWAQYRPNVNKGVHCLRHTFGVRLCDNSNGNVQAVKSALGHRSLNSTQVYTDYVQGQKQLRKAMAGMWSGKLCDVA
jgi:integrase/recombinase XerC